MPTLNINGKPYDIDLPTDTPLLWVLRDEIGLTGTKFGCGMALCGACTVHIDGEPARACVTPISALAGKEYRDHRGDRRGSGGQDRAVGVDRRGSPAVRLLPGRPDHVRDGAAQAHAATHRLGDRLRHGRQPVSLWHLYAHPRRHQAGRWRKGSDVMSAPLVIANVSRRDFLQGASALGGLVLAVGYAGVLRAEDPPKYGAEAMPHGWVDNPLVFVAIGEDGIVSIVCHRSEMGQGVRTGMPMIIADELEADWARVRVVQAPGDEERYGNQDTDGSRSTRHFFMPMRRCGAAARQMLETAAAASWQVPVTEVRAQNNEVVHTATGRRLGYGALAKAASSLPLPAPDTIRLKDPAQFRYVGAAKVPLFDGPDIASGKAQYGMDTHLPGMLYAVIARPQVLGGKVVHYDAKAALKVPGVVRVVAIAPTPGPAGFNPLGGIAVIARNTWAAIQGRKALKITWNDGANAHYDSVAYRATLESAVRKPGKVVRNDGDATAALAAAAKRVSAEYYLPHLAHAPMEPPAATARFEQGKCEVWGCFQSPQGARDLIAKRLDLPVANVTVHVTLLGGGFGRKSMSDFGIEAALLAREMQGKPVKVVWTREDDLQNGYFHTVSVEHLEAGLDGKGHPVAWLHRTVAPSIDSLFDAKARREGELRTRHGRHQRAVRHPEHPHRKPGSRGACAHRLVSFSVQHSPRLRGAVVHRRAGRSGRARPEGVPARGDRSAARGDAADDERHLQRRRVTRALHRRYRADAQRHRARREAGRVGSQAPQGQRAGHRRALQLRQLRRRGRGSGR